MAGSSSTKLETSTGRPTSVDWAPASCSNCRPLPMASLTFDSAHNLYGTASQGGSLPGGAPGNGVVFKLWHASSRNWKETTLHTFSVSDGAVPASVLLLDPSGQLGGTTNLGGLGSNSIACGYTSCGERNESLVFHRFVRDLQPLVDDGKRLPQLLLVNAQWRIRIEGVPANQRVEPLFAEETSQSRHLL
jgi:hypothetical protein